MNTLDTPAQMDTAHTDGYITEFKEKSEFEQRINTACDLYLFDTE